MTVSARITLLLVIAATGLSLLAGIAFLTFYRLDTDIRSLTDDTLQSSHTILLIQTFTAHSQAVSSRRIYWTNGHEEQDVQRAELDSKSEKLFQQYSKLLVTDAQDKRLMEASQQLFGQWRSSVDESITAALEQRLDDAILIEDQQAKPLAQKLRAALEEWADYSDRLGNLSRQSAFDSMALARYEIAVASAVTVAVVLLLGIWLYRSILVPMRSLRQAARDMAETLDFSQRSPATSNDEIGQTVSAFNQLIGSIEKSMLALQKASDEVYGMAGTMEQGAMAVASDSRTQSDATNSMAAAVQELTTSISHVSDRAQLSAEAAARSGSSAEQGGQLIGRTAEEIRQVGQSIEGVVNLVEEVEQRSQQIDVVVKVIRDVAEQTNLLALNAAIEAARAGEQGRGFAVVADEVRLLAERTASSTGEINNFINQMKQSSLKASQQVRGAMQLAQACAGQVVQVEEAMLAIRDSSSVALHLASDISAAISQQGVASNEIAAQVESVALMTSRNSESAERSASSAGSLKSITQRLNSEIGAYRFS
ncbi:methyl-accepting chemotaxis protein [Pseudomonas sp. LS_2]|uniref:methyl-accepting chemotaxis protein n=1 Tax=Pseudomonas sp. LS_2 TaxID=3055789 RepID=UPI00365CADA8